jgi:selenocysteine lyase/cysteine desulfurase
MAIAGAASVSWEAVRASFPGLEDKVFLDAACVSLAPSEAGEAIRRFVERVTMLPSVDATEHHIFLDEGRRGAAKEAANLIGASEDEIALVESTSHGLALAANGLALSGDDNVVLCDLEFVGVATPWAVRARETGLDLRFVRNREGRIEIEDIEKSMDGRTKVICISSVMWSSGHRLDLAALSALASSRGAILILDVIQHLGPFRLDVRETPADVVVCGGHKWLNAPFGCGFMYIRKESLPRFRPSLWGYLNLTPPEGGWGTYFATPTISPLRPYEFVKEARKMETGGTSNYPGAFGLAASLALFNRIGPRAIEDRVQHLVGRLIEGLDAEKFRLVSPREARSRSGIVVFTARGGSGQDGGILARLRERRVCISQRYTNGVGGLRASVHFFNNEADVDTLVREAARTRDGN